jgi:hypothetical protein
MTNRVGLLSNQGIPRHGCHVPGGSQPRGAGHHGSSVDLGVSSRETKTLHGSRNLPDDGADLEFADDRAGDVAFVPATSEASVPKVLHKWYYAAATIHAFLGITAELLGLYIVIVAGTNVLPQWLRFKDWKRWMRTELMLWSIVVLTGVGTYYAWYIAPFR